MNEKTVEKMRTGDLWVLSDVCDSLSVLLAVYHAVRRWQMALPGVPSVDAEAELAKLMESAKKVIVD